MGTSCSTTAMWYWSYNVFLRQKFVYEDHGIIN